MTSPSSWKASINRLLNQQSHNSRIAILGIGNTLRSDDAAGILVARTLMNTRLIRDLETVLVIEAGFAPENKTAELRRFQSDVVLLVDAAQLGEMPGTIRWIEMDELDGMSASTHTLPLSMLASYLTLELDCAIGLLGIQPKSNDVGEGVSVEVSNALNEIAEYLIRVLAPRAEMTVR